MFFEYDSSYTGLPRPWAIVREVLLEEQFAPLQSALETALASGIGSEEEALVALEALRKTFEVPEDQTFPDPLPEPFDRTLLGSWTNRPRVIANLHLAWAAHRGVKASEELLEVEQRKATGQLSALLTATHASLLAFQGRRRAVQARAEELEGTSLLPEDAPWIYWRVGDALCRVRCWAQAEPWLERAITAAPTWVRPHFTLLGCLEARGERERAETLLHETMARFPESSAVRWERIVEAWLRHDWPQVLLHIHDFHRARMEQPPGQEDPFLMMRVVALWKVGRVYEARDLVANHDETWAAHFQRLEPNQRVWHVRVRPMVQDRYMCVSTAIAMMLETMGIEVESAALYAAMDGGHGLTTHQVDTWLGTQGLARVALGCDRALMRGALERGRPMLCTSASVGSSHMELVVGLHEDLDCVEILDPGSGTPHFRRFEEFAERYAREGMGVSIIVPEVLPDAWQDFVETARSQQADRLERVSSLTWQGHHDAAEAVLKDIDAGGPRDQLYRRHLGVFCEASEEVPLLERIASNEALPAIERLAAMLDLQDRGTRRSNGDIDAIVATLDPVSAAMMQVTVAMQRGEWEDARQRCEALLGLSSAEMTWLQYASILQQLDNEEASFRALQIARDIAPDCSGVALRAHELEKPTTLSERSAALDTFLVLVRRDPHNLSLRRVASTLALELARPHIAWALVLEGLRLHPRSPFAVSLVQHVFERNENRPDLVIAHIKSLGRGGVLEHPAAKPLLPLGEMVDNAATSPAEIAPSAAQPLPDLPFRQLVFTLEGAHPERAQELADEVRRRLEEDPTLSHEERFSAETALLVCTLSGDRLLPMATARTLLPQEVPTPVLHHAAHLGSCVLSLKPRKSITLLILDWLDHHTAAAPPHREVALVRAQLLVAADRSEEATHALHAVLEQWKDPRAHGELGLLALRRGELEAARSHTRTALKAFPGDHFTAATLADIAQRSGAADDMLEALEHRIRLAPLNDSHAYDYLEHRLVNQSRDAAEQWLARNGHRYSPWLADWVEARRHELEGRATGVLQHVSEDLIVAYPQRIASWFFGTLLQSKRPKTFADLVQRAARDMRTRHLDEVAQAYSLVQVDLVKEVSFFRSRFLETRTVVAAFRWLSRVNPSAYAAHIQELFESLPSPGNRLVLVGSLYRALLELGDTPLASELLQSALQDHPNDLELLYLAIGLADITSDAALRERAVSALLPLSADETGAALEMADALLPSRPEVAERLAHADLLRNASAENVARWIDLFVYHNRLAALTDPIVAALERDPAQPAALRALVLLDEPPETVAPYLQPALDTPVDAYPRGLAAELVHWALQHAYPLPARWEAWAIAQFHHTQSHEPDSPDGPLLSAALHVWCIVHKRPHVLHLLQLCPAAAVEFLKPERHGALAYRVRWCIDLKKLTLKERFRFTLWWHFLRAPWTAPLGYIPKQHRLAPI